MQAELAREAELAKEAEVAKQAGLAKKAKQASMGALDTAADTWRTRQKYVWKKDKKRACILSKNQNAPRAAIDFWVFRMVRIYEE